MVCRYCPVKWGGELTWLSGVSRVEWAQPGDLHRKPIEIGIVVHTKWFGHETSLNGSLTVVISGQRGFDIQPVMSADILAELPSDDTVISINRADNEQYPRQDPSLINGMTCIHNLYCHSLNMYIMSSFTSPESHYNNNSRR